MPRVDKEPKPTLRPSDLRPNVQKARRLRLALCTEKLSIAGLS